MFGASKTARKAAASTGDPYWSSVSLLTNFENNLSFQDGSTNNFAITRNGTVNPSVNSPFSGQGGSQYFNGSSYLSTGANSVCAFGTGNFTVEYWIYYTAFQTTKTVIDGRGSNVSTTGYSDYYTSAGKFALYLNNSNIYTSTTTVTANAWNHIAVCRTGTGTNQTLVFINGVQDGSLTYSTNVTDTGFLFGTNFGNSGPITANVSNLRVVKGTAVYTANFTPPTAPLTAISGTSLLITGTGQGMYDNSTFVDQGPNALTVTATGTPVYSGLSPFGNSYPGSVLLNGTSQYLSVPNNAAFQFGTGDFTVEAWVYLITKPINRRLFSFGNYATSGNFQIEIPGNSNNDILVHINGSFSTYTYTVNLSTWFHVAICRVAGNVTVYVNGVSLGTQTQSGTVNNSTDVFAIGAQSNGTNPFNGYISNTRIVKGTALYTSNFTPSTTPLTAVTNTSLLIRGDTGAFYDLSNNGNPESNTGTTAVTTQFKKYGNEGGSYSSVSYQTVTNAVNLQFGTGDFTVEAWVYRTASGAPQPFVCKGTATTGWLFQINASNQLSFTVGSTVLLTSTTTISATTWTFVTVTRSGSSVRIFINGNLEATATDSTDFSQTDALLIGCGRGLSNGLTGYLDDLRITKGVARYTANFTPPTQTFPTGP
jgi:hypothetical protein